jgi:hypothetical protein
MAKSKQNPPLRRDVVGSPSIATQQASYRKMNGFSSWLQWSSD